MKQNNRKQLRRIRQRLKVFTERVEAKRQLTLYPFRLFFVIARLPSGTDQRLCPTENQDLRSRDLISTRGVAVSGVVDLQLLSTVLPGLPKSRQGNTVVSCFIYLCPRPRRDRGLGKEQLHSVKWIVRCDGLRRE